MPHRGKVRNRKENSLLDQISYTNADISCVSITPRTAPTLNMSLKSGDENSSTLKNLLKWLKGFDSHGGFSHQLYLQHWPCLSNSPDWRFPNVSNSGQTKWLHLYSYIWAVKDHFICYAPTFDIVVLSSFSLNSPYPNSVEIATSIRNTRENTILQTPAYSICKHKDFIKQIICQLWKSRRSFSPVGSATRVSISKTEATIDCHCTLMRCNMHK